MARQGSIGGGWRRRVWMALVLALTLAAAAGVAAAASAAVGGRTPRAATRATPPVRPTAAERRAITIRSLTAANDPSTGLIATARFDGDIERYLGQGGLRQAVLALVLVPKTAGTSATGILDEGGGFIAARLPRLIQRGGRSHATPARWPRTLTPVPTLRASPGIATSAHPPS